MYQSGIYINIKISQSQHVWKFSSNWKRGRAQEQPLTESLFCCESWVFLHSNPDTTVCKMELDAHAININESYNAINFVSLVFHA